MGLITGTAKVVGKTVKWTAIGVGKGTKKIYKACTSKKVEEEAKKEQEKKAIEEENEKKIAELKKQGL